MSLRWPQAGTFERKLQEVRIEAEELVRLSRFPDSEPHWSRGRYRFDGPIGGAFGTCYASMDLEVAFCESVIHENSWGHGAQYQVPMALLTSRHVVHLHRPAAPELVLADLTGAALKALKLKNDISAGDDYSVSMAWARAIHDADAKWDGICYVSRQLNTGRAIALFERSRVTKAHSYKLSGQHLDDLCDKFDVVAI